ncbi:hypothetical protein ACF3NA_03490 [Alkanindiges sp. WGS2144]|uniref:hypothetical protein n=1 Tax=Alkanindiges sp. WGS2144 TaxID=3366808 RepID=UPI003751D7EB
MRKLSKKYNTYKVNAVSAGVVLLLSSALHAATPLNDMELNDNFLHNEIAVPQLALERLQNPAPIAEAEQQLQVIDQNERINNVFADLVKASGISNVHLSLDKKDREVNYTTNNPLFGLEILNQIAMGDFGSEPFSFRWHGNYHQIFDLSQISGIYFDHSTGSYEIENVRGKVEFEVSSYEGNEAGRKFRREIHVF